MSDEKRFSPEFQVLRVSKQSLQSLPTDQQAALCTSCYAIDEIAVFTKLVMWGRVGKGTSENSSSLTAQVAQQFVIARTHTSKLYEYFSFLAFKGAYGRTKDPLLTAVAAQLAPLIDQVKEHPGFKIVQEVRNTAGFHYRLKPSRAYVDALTEGADLNLYLNANNLNSRFPMGEECLFGGILSDAIMGSEEDYESAMQKLLEWGYEASKLAMNCHTELMLQILDGSEVVYARDNETISVPNSAIGKVGEFAIPTFVEFQ